MLNICEMLGASFLLVLGLMAILWVVYFVKRNAGIVDIGWTLSFVLAAWAYLFMGQGYGPKKLVITAMVTIWALRLGWHLYQRYISTPEDPRYAALRQKWGGDKEGILFLMMFLFQGLIAIILSIPFLIVSHTSEPEWSGWEFVGVVVWAMGVAGESLADHQLKSFKADPANRGKVCEAGLWHFSRHPNYFFEWVVWVGYFLFALQTTGGWIAVIAPVLMLALLLKVTGIPTTEAQMLVSKGSAYQAYQKTTSPFFPWFRNPE